VRLTEIGKPIREVVVEPLEDPVPDVEPAEEPAPVREPLEEPEKIPA
jgi:hypothetical protein